MKKLISDYKNLMNEISEEVAEGVLSQNDMIQVLRDTSPIMETYFPIVDWYYDEFTMKEELRTPLEEMYMKEEFTPEEWKELEKEQEEFRKQYETDEPKLVSMKVKDVLTEMKQIQKLF